MPWNLTTPTDGGDLADNAAQVKITRFAVYTRQKRIGVDLEYGNTVDGVWIKAHEPPPGKPPTLHIENKDGESDFDDFVLANQQLYDDVKAAIYAQLAADSDIDPGAVA